MQYSFRVSKNSNSARVNEKPEQPRKVGAKPVEKPRDFYQQDGMDFGGGFADLLRGGRKTKSPKHLVL